MNRLDRPLGLLLEGEFGDWQPLLDRWGRSRAGAVLIGAVNQRVASGALVYPGEPFRALALTPMARTRVLILGQDPYHGAQQAEGLAFSVPEGLPAPPSLRNIFKELRRDLGLPVPSSGSLLPWAQQGVLLLNSSLTVEDGQAGGHGKLGWQALTDEIFVALARDEQPKVFMLWGAQAQAKAALLDDAARRAHLVLQCNHPSPLSATRPPAPFIGCGHFSRANAFLADRGRGAIDWRLP